MAEDRQRSNDAGTDDRVGSINEVFSVLGDETRLRILRVLTEVASEEGIGRGLSFADLRKRVGGTDSGRFNYHLDKLQDGFVTKRDEEYVARLPGLAVISSMYAGLYEDADVREPTVAETAFECGDCSRPLDVQYGDRELGPSVWMYCEEHGKLDRYWFPPGARSGRSPQELMTVAYTRLLTNVDLARRGICMECWGQVTLDYPVDDRDGVDTPEPFLTVELRCERCWNRLSVPLRTVLLTHSIVLAAFQRRGYEPLEAADAISTRGDSAVCETELERTDPTRANVRIEFDDGELAVTVDEDCSVVDRRWR